MKFSKLIKSIVLAAFCIFLLSCISKADPDIALIETIENNLLPSIMIEGGGMEGMNIYERMEYYHVPGVSIAFLNRGEIVWAKGYGYTSADSSRLVDENTIFQAASISKPLTAMAALALVEEGKIGLDDDVNLYLKSWQLEENRFTSEEKVTLRRILSHSAGLTVHGFGGYASGEKVPTSVQVLSGEDPSNSGRIFPDTVPGAHYSYSGGGYTVMQLMLCDITGKTFPELMEELVLSKIGMKSSTYEQPLPETSWENAARAHDDAGEMIEGRWHTYPEMAAAGLWTTPGDLLRYVMEVQQSYAGASNLILSREMTREMLTPQLNNHGLGPGVGGSGDSITFSHGGANRGFRCGLLAFTKQGQGLVMMTNGTRGGELMSEIRRSFSASYGWNIKPELKSLAPLEKKDLEAFLGQYMLRYDKQELILEISLLDKHLKGLQIWNDFLFEMYPESATRFFNMDDGAEFEFSLNEEGDVTAIQVYEHGQVYTFSKI